VIDYTSLNLGQDSIDESLTPAVPLAIWLRKVVLGEEKSNSLYQAETLPYITTTGTAPKKTSEEVFVTID
jgi:hypothetical protein